MKKLWIIKEDNDEVTMGYMSIIRDAAIFNGIDVEIVDFNYAKDNSNKDDVFFAILSKTFFKLRLSGRKNICLWLQGIVPEESYLKHKSKIRYYLLSLIEKYSIKKSKLTLYVSETMKNYVYKKYNIKDTKLFSIMPCFNTSINKMSFFNEKYENNVFCYAGGMSVWQEFDKVLRCYNEIEKSGLANCKLLLLVPNRELAIEKIKQYGIKNYEIDYVSVDELNSRIKEAKYGFLFRKDHPVNNVATPTKFSTYLANGIIPIFSDVLLDFYEQSKDMKYVIAVHENESFIHKLSKYESINPEDIFNEYKDIFDMYYNPERYVKIISSKLNEIDLIG